MKSLCFWGLFPVFAMGCLAGAVYWTLYASFLVGKDFVSWVMKP